MLRIAPIDAESLVSQGMLTVPQAAAMMGISKGTVYNLLDRGDLPRCKILGSTRIPRKSVVEYLANSLESGPSSNASERHSEGRDVEPSEKQAAS